jgi:hypothetical protein
MTTKYQPAQIAFRYRTSDSPAGVTRETAQRLAEVLGVAETQAIHLALHELASRCCRSTSPTRARSRQRSSSKSAKLAGKVDTSRVRSSLFDDESE